MRRQLPIGHERRHGDQHHGLQQWRRPTDGDAAQLHAGSPGRPAPRQLHVPEQRHGGAPVLELLLHLARETVPDAEWYDLLSVARRSATPRRTSPRPHWARLLGMSGSTGRASFYLSGARLLLYRIALSIGARGSWAGGVDANTAFSQLERRRGADAWTCPSLWRVLPKTPALPASWARAAAARHFPKGDARHLFLARMRARCPSVWKAGAERCPRAGPPTAN